MSRGPLTALLAVLAVAGYQNRDKIADVLKGLQGGRSTNPNVTNTDTAGGGLGDVLGNLTSGRLGNIFSGSSPGGILSGGLGGLIDQFRQNGLGDRTDSWVTAGPNQPIEEHELSQALGEDVLNELTTKTGLSKDEILRRLQQDLPKAVNDLTPDGVVPSEDQFSEIIRSPAQTSVPNVGRVV